MNDIHLSAESAIGAPSVVITGATEGIGKALAHEFARAGNTLLLVARDEARLRQTAAEISSAYGVQVRFTSQDLSTEEGCAGVEQALRRYGLYADVLVNNAGFMCSGFFQDQSLKNMLGLVNLDVRAVVDLSLRFLPGMLARGRGGILNVASMLGYVPVPYQATYAAAKAFVLSFSRSLSYETMGTGVTVSALAPGAVGTRLHAKAGAQNSLYLRFFAMRTPEQVAAIAYKGFLRRRSVILPGFLNPLGAFAMRFVPHVLIVPLMGLLFRVRDNEGNIQEAGPLPRVPSGHRLPVAHVAQED